VRLSLTLVDGRNGRPVDALLDVDTAPPLGDLVPALVRLLGEVPRPRPAGRAGLTAALAQPDSSATRPRRTPRIAQTNRFQSTSRTTVSATQAGLDSPSISMSYFSVICLPVGMSSTPVRVTWPRTREPTLTGWGKRTLLTP
jgi:hypothetical protein